MTHRHDKTRATIAVAKIELARMGPSAAVPPFGMCPEPSPIKPDNFLQGVCAIPIVALPDERVCPAIGHTNRAVRTQFDCHERSCRPIQAQRTHRFGNNTG
jgi:hypothetical protein